MPRADGRERHAVLSALSFDMVRGVAGAALDAGCPYFDLTEDVEATQFANAAAGRA